MSLDKEQCQDDVQAILEQIDIKRCASVAMCIEAAKTENVNREAS